MALVFEPRVRAKSETVGTGNIVLAGRMFGSLDFADVLASGDTFDCVVSHGDAFEEFFGSFNASGEIVRGTVYRSRHANGTVDKNHVSFAIGIKTVIMTASASRYAALEAFALRYNVSQSLSPSQKAAVWANLGLFPSGTTMLFVQATAPTGWTKSLAHNDKTLRIVSGTPSSGGSVNFSTLFGRTTVDGTTLSSTQIPVITPTGANSKPAIIQELFAFQTNAGGAGLNNWGVGSSGIGLELNGPPIFTGNSFGGGLSHNHGLDLRVRYVDALIATKD